MAKRKRDIQLKFRVTPQERQKTSVRDKLKKPPETTSPKISAKSKAPER